MNPAKHPRPGGALEDVLRQLAPECERFGLTPNQLLTEIVHGRLQRNNQGGLEWTPKPFDLEAPQP